MKTDVLTEVTEPVLPIILIDGFLGPRLRYWLSKFFAALILFFALASIALNISSLSLPAWSVGPLAAFLSIIGKFPGVHLDNSSVVQVSLLPFRDLFTLHLSQALGLWNGVLLIALFCYVTLHIMNAYARSSYYRGLVASERKQAPVASYAVLEIFAHATFGDIVKSFFLSDSGRVIMLRAGISPELIAEFIATRTEIVDYRNDENLRNIHTISDLVRFLVLDTGLRSWLENNTIESADLIDAAEWIEAKQSLFDSYERSWGKAAQSRKGSIGEDLAYGQAFVLKRYAAEVIVPPAELGQQYGGENVLRLEQSLARDKGANALLIAPAPHIAEEIIAQFARDIVYHFEHPFLKGKRCFLFDVQYFCKDMDSATAFEQALAAVLEDATRAGNIIFIISDLPALYLRSRQLGADVAGVMRSYLSDNVLQVIAISDTAQYHELLAPQALLAEHYHDIHIGEPENDSLLSSLKLIADQIELEHDIYFTIPALHEVSRDAERTLVHGLLVDRAREILEGLPAFLELQKVQYVLPTHVDAYVSQASHIPIGKADDKEKQQLLHLEQSLHTSVVGQDLAITAIADALRRSRAGVRNEKRPVASFFFFGPTGVGKTEVAKTLARVFFGGEDKILRLDMTEFADRMALARLIGTIDGGHGALASILREHPYGVLLLDEFEKADSAVHDLFLQVLDEGVFHDAQGQVVNCRNTIIIATSNVGAAEIYAHTKDGGEFDLPFTHAVIEKIVASGNLRPELLNRFDGTILFTPINERGYRKIAQMMLEKLATRLRDRGIILVIDDVLINTIMSKGIDPVFGARPMQRAIQDIVEKKVAQKILEGKTGPGVPLKFSAEELQ